MTIWLVPCDGEGSRIFICKSTVNYSACSFDMKDLWIYELIINNDFLNMKLDNQNSDEKESERDCIDSWSERE